MISAPQPEKLGDLGSRAWARLFSAWLIALLATAGALFLGEVLGMTPCVLCWYQRIAMFPLVLVLGVALLDADPRAARFGLPLAGLGLGIALYHCLIFWGVVSEALSPCREGVSCADAELQVAGFVPIPLLSLIAFAAIVVLLWSIRRRGNP